MDMKVDDASLSSFIGEAVEDSSGAILSGAGDVNGDGYDDFLIGSELNDEGGIDAGQIYLFLGRSNGWSMDTGLSSADASFIGEAAGDHLAFSSSAGDVNDDGFDDILIGAYQNDEGGANAGQTYLFLGQSSGWSMDTDPSSADASFIGETAGDFSRISSGAGDVNGDGFDDIIIGAERNSEGATRVGQTYLIFGKSSGWAMDTDLSLADASFIGEAAHDGSGTWVSGAGDVNDDGYDDFLIGAPGNNEGGTIAGQTYLILGKSSGWSMDTSLTNSSASFIGEDSSDYSGSEISGAFDVNCDGYDDILIGAYGGGGAVGGGEAYLILGKSSGWDMDTDLSLANASFVGEALLDHAGISVSGAGDVNGDGFDDFLIGAYHNDEGGSDAGQTYLILGKTSGWSMNKDLSSVDASFIGEAANDWLLRTSGAGDLNGDGYDDILIGTWQNDEGGTNAGQTYLIAGFGFEEPLEVYSIDTYSDPSCLNKIDKIDIDETIYIELVGQDGNISKRDTAKVNITSTSSIPLPIALPVVETGINTGRYRGQFKVHQLMDYFENITITSWKDPSKTAIVQVNTPIRIEPNQNRINWTEDEFMQFHFQNLGYHTVDQWSINTNAEWINWDETEQKINGTPDNSMVGKYWVNISAEDNKFNKDHMNFTIDVQNTPPSIFTENLEEIDQGEYYHVDYESDDEGCGDTEWFMEPSLTWLKLDSKSGVLNGTPTNTHIGTYEINIWVNDGNGGSNSTEFVLNVVDVNDPPAILTEDVTTIDQNQLYYVRYYAEDIDGTYDFEWHLKTDANWLSIDNKSGLLTGTPGYGNVGNFYVNISVEDDRGGREHTNFTLTVIDVNDEPEWSKIPSDVQIDQGDIFSFDVDAIDHDKDDTITFAVSTDPPSDMAIEDGTGDITWTSTLEGLTPNPNYVLNVEISATDGEETIKHGFTITVIPNPSPTSTILGPDDSKRVTSEGILLEWEGTDDGEEPLKYDIYLGQSETQVSLLDRSALWMEDIDVNSIDTGPLQAGKTYYWTVIPKDIYSLGICTNNVFSFIVNIPPSIQDFTVPQAKIGVEFRLNLIGSDPNNDDLELSIVQGPSGMEVFDGMITWTPAESQVGTHNMNVSLSDGYETTYEEFEVTVAEEEIVIEPDDKASPIVPIIIVIVVVLVLAGAGIGIFLFMKNRGKPEPSEDSEEEKSPPEDTGPSEEEKQAYNQLYGPD